MIVIGDVHGHFNTLVALLQQLPTDDEICFVGDLIDRGPRSMEVVELVKSRNYKCVLGNHEDIALHHYGKVKRGYGKGLWLYNGGIETQKSYGGDISEDHLNWMKQLPVYLDFPDIKDARGRGLMVSHATVRPYVSEDIYQLEKVTDLEDENIDSNIIWNRTFCARIKDRFHISGHTPQRRKVLIEDHFAVIDSGVYFETIEGASSGHLTALQYPSMTLYSQPNIDREEDVEGEVL